jgi:hypothetical protein
LREVPHSIDLIAKLDEQLCMAVFDAHTQSFDGLFDISWHTVIMYSKSKVCNIINALHPGPEASGFYGASG